MALLWWLPCNFQSLFEWAELNLCIDTPRAFADFVANHTWHGLHGLAWLDVKDQMQQVQSLRGWTSRSSCAKRRYERCRMDKANAALSHHHRHSLILLWLIKLRVNPRSYFFSWFETLMLHPSFLEKLNHELVEADTLRLSMGTKEQWSASHISAFNTGILLVKSRDFLDHILAKSVCVGSCSLLRDNFLQETSRSFSCHSLLLTSSCYDSSVCAT